MQAAEARLAGTGRILLRASGTEPLLRVMVEGQDAELVNNIAEELATVVRDAAAQIAQVATAG
jgi:phosphoglucosamine mutase